MSLNPQEFTKQCKWIMLDFDFKKVHQVMVAANITWIFTGQEARVPTVEEIQRAALKSLQAAADTDEDVETMGLGFIARLSDGYLRLTYVIEDSCSKDFDHAPIYSVVAKPDQN